MSADIERVFVDSNVLIYAYDRSADSKLDRARDVVQELWELDNGCLSIQVLQEFYVNATGKISPPISMSAAAVVVEDLARWSLHRPTPGDILGAINLSMQHQLSFWDAMIIQSALQLGCSTLLTEDLSHGQVIETVTIKNPFRAD